ncbi:MAG: LL-diaminopimelate aminotransferase [Spirochaetales bacterium]|nr:LL-diaminopimelate aminotransferase [Spirochaetales bacterium]
MIRVNENYLKLQSSYLFSEISKRITAFRESHPEREIIKLGIGDVTCALPAACVAAFHAAATEMGDERTFRGYGPEQGYEFLREKIAVHDYKERGAEIEAGEIFISDGAKCDVGNIQELFAEDVIVAVPDPVYPVYVDTNVMAGRSGDWQDASYRGLVYLKSTEHNNYVPELPETKVDLIYLCFPNNPTGATISREKLREWVTYAQKNNALIIYDAAYEAFIKDETLPRSIFEIQGAKEVAVEIRSFSKTAGFTGTRCAYTVVPEACNVYTRSGTAVPLHTLWLRRQTTKFNGVSYPVQRAAEAVFSAEGKKQVKDLIDYYMHNAGLIRKRFSEMGFLCTGGDNSPYIWIQAKMASWDFFNLLLEKAGVVCTPGSGFGKCGEGYVRISAFNSHENVEKALHKISDVFR